MARGPPVADHCCIGLCCFTKSNIHVWVQSLEHLVHWCTLGRIQQCCNLRGMKTRLAENTPETGHWKHRWWGFGWGLNSGHLIEAVSQVAVSPPPDPCHPYIVPAGKSPNAKTHQKRECKCNFYGSSRLNVKYWEWGHSRFFRHVTWTNPH